MDHPSSEVSSGAIEFASAKVNLALHVTGRRLDGYHLIESLVVFTRFGDRVAVAAAERDAFAADGPFADDVPKDDGNLVIQARDAVRALLQRNGRPAGPVAITLTKNLPVASGVGGGSSDAAATLKVLNHVWAAGLSPQQLAELGLALGADVPMCLDSRPLVASGIGDIIATLSDAPALGLVLVNPGVAIATADVFQKLDRRDNPGLPPPPSRLDFHDLRNWLSSTRNDLEPVASTLQPAIRGALAALDRAGSGFSRMSGSGATCFGLFETGNVAKRAAETIRRRHPDWFVAATRTIPSEAPSDVTV